MTALHGPISNDNAENAAPQQTHEIRDVWASNLQEEFRHIRTLVPTHKYVAMDTEFPGVVARPVGQFRSGTDYQYQILKCNVERLKIIQLGMTFLDENGNSPANKCSTWQFNFKFDLSKDMYAQDSIELLIDSGIIFDKHEAEGIEQNDFAELLMSSGVVLMDINWITFHGCYDFGYLLRLLIAQNLPVEDSEFLEDLGLYFNNIYDVKVIMKDCYNLKGGLQEVATRLELERVGTQHQAGSDSLLTGAAFFKIKELYFDNTIDDSKYCGNLFGLRTYTSQPQEENSSTGKTS